LAKNGIITFIYPLEGHEKAIGLNLFKHPERRNIVNLSLKTLKTYLAGPVQLLEGGIGFIIYTPIFIKKNNEKKIWGLCDIVIYRDKLFNEVDLKESDSKNKYALKGNDGKGESGNIFWGDTNVFKQNPIKTEIILPTGKWILAATPIEGWNSYSDLKTKFKYLSIIISIIISLLFWVLIKALIKIKQNEKTFKALFKAMEQIILVFDDEGRYIYIAPTNERLLYLERNKLLNRTLHEIFDKQTADFFLNTIKKCLETKELIIIDYPLEIKGETLWFQGRLTPLTSNSILFVAQDQTNTILTRKALEQSEKNLKEINETKDKFFSIIAHDLRAPLGAFLNITQLLHNDYDILEEQEKREFIEMMHKTSKSIYDLLENLLMWSKSESGKIIFEPSTNPITYVCDNAYSIYYPIAKEKNIELINNVKSKCLATYDYNTILTVLRNLISNAIKYTPSSGKIIINCKKHQDSNELIISVSDTGIGIPKEKINDLFKIESHFSTPGTNDEKGSGLGLILSKEFVEKNGGKIWVKSQQGKGSTFYFTLPIEVNFSINK